MWNESILKTGNRQYANQGLFINIISMIVKFDCISLSYDDHFKEWWWYMFDVLVYIKNEIAKGQGRGYVGG